MCGYWFCCRQKAAQPAWVPGKTASDFRRQTQVETGGNVEIAAGSGTVRPDKRGGRPIREAGVCVKNFGSVLLC